MERKNEFPNVILIYQWNNFMDLPIKIRNALKASLIVCDDSRRGGFVELWHVNSGGEEFNALVGIGR